MVLAPELVAILACPACRGKLEMKGKDEGLACSRCAVVYPVREDIPVMLVEEAVPFRQWEDGRREAAPK